jgi:hypothetical protein
MLHDLVLAATAINGGSFANPGECQRGLRDLWTLDFEIDEIRQTRDELQRAGAVALHRAGWTLTDTTKADLEERAAASAETEDRALAEWRETLQTLRPDLTDHDFKCLCEDLSEWLNRIIVRHGVEAALVLYPEDQRAHTLYKEIDALGTSFLPERGGLVGQLREDALRRFVREAKPVQRAFLANRMNTAFYLTVLTLDPEAREIVQAGSQGRRVYLDTNFLYAVLGAANAIETASAHRLLDLTRGLGIQLAVTPWTVEELHTSIRTAQRNAERLPMKPQFAQVMLAAVGEKGYSAAFWRAFHRTGVRPQDWFDRAAHFEHDLDRLRIDIVDEGCARVDRETALVNEYAALLDRVLGLGRDRHEEVLEHDAKHRILVERLRGNGHLTFSTARFWFLTQDNQLPHFAAEMPDADERAPDLPFCISPSSWVQVVRALTPRTEEFEETVVALLTSPYVGYRPVVDQRTVREVVARIDTLEDASPELAIAVLEDSALVRDISDATDEEVEERVRAAYSTKTRELQEQASAVAAEAAAERSRREAAEGREAATVRDLEAEKRRREGAETDAARERREREALERRLDNKIDETEKAADEAIAAEREKREALEHELARRERLQARNRRIGLGSAIAAASILVPVFLMVFVTAKHAYELGGLAGGSLFLFLLGLRVALGSRWGGEVIAWAFGLVGVLGTIVSVIAILASRK